MIDLLPDMIENLPEIDMPVDGVEGRLIQGENTQVVVFMVKEGVYLPVHTHAAQWGAVVEGEFEITYPDKKITYHKGDTYYVPANTPHAGYYVTDTVTFDIFDDKNKFKIKEA